MRPPLINAPLTRWTRKLAVVAKTDPDAYSELVNHPDLDLKYLFKQDIAYRKAAGRNGVYQIKGPPGSGKSKAVGLPLARLISGDWRPKGNTFYTNDDIIQASNSADKGAVFVKDEDPEEGGQGSESVEMALRNLESACARFAEIWYIFINPGETSHRVDFILDTTREESRRYDGKIISAKVNVGAWSQDEQTLEVTRLNIGTMELDVPESIVPEYETLMKRFKDSLRSSGGFGVRRDVFQRYFHLVKELPLEQEWLDIPIGRSGYFTEKHESYISTYHGINERDAGVWLLKGWRLVKPKGDQVKTKEQLAKA